MKIGVFGGTFDPVHYGHLRMAEICRETLQLETVLFVPNQVSPFKTRQPITPGDMRIEMLNRATVDNPAFVVSTLELDRPGPSYTVDTLRILQTENPDAELFFLTGSDAVKGLPNWVEPEALLELARFVALTRPGVTQEQVLAALPETWERRILFMEMPGLDISSTDLRNRAKTNRSIRYLTPPDVAAFIAEHHLYDTTNTTIRYNIVT